MCLNPITITNPSFGKRSYASQHGDLVQVPKAFTPNTKEMKVPCGKCPECRASRYNAILQRSLVESMTAYMYFVTLTYDNHHIPCLKFPDGKKIYFADYQHIIDLFKRVRNQEILDRDFRYLCVNEYGDSTNRPHFHIIIFVARKDTDKITTPYDIERTLFENIKKLYAINVGTRKEPEYQPLFTYHRWYNPLKNRVEDNYRVTYVKPTTPLNQMQEFLVPDLTTVKTTKYTVGYVQKPSDFEVSVEKYLQKYKDDAVMHNQLKRIFKSQIRYSKGFGCGFTNGKKYYLPRISVRASANAIYYSDLMKVLPKTYYEFQELYPDQAEELEAFRKYDIYRRYRKLSWNKCLKHMTTEQYMNHCIYVKYFKKEFTQRYKTYFKRDTNTQATVSYYYNYAHRNYYYSPPTVFTTKPEDSPVYRFLRKGVEEGIASKVPYLAFKMIGERRFTALCRYYKERICTIDDTRRMYAAVGVANYEEWQALFEKQKNNRISTLFAGNQLKYYNEYKKIIQSTCKNEKNCLYLHQYQGEDMYRYLLSNRKASNPSQKGV